MVQYECKICAYNSIYRSHYTRHLQTKKHKRNQKNQETLGATSNDFEMTSNDFEMTSNDFEKASNEPFILKKYKCEYCHKKFTRANNRNYHIKHRCQKKEETVNTIHNITNNKTINNNTQNIMMMAPKELMNTYYSDSPELQELTELIGLKGIEEEDKKRLISGMYVSADETCYNVLASVLDEIFSKKYKELISARGAKEHDTYMIVNDRNNRSYLSKGLTWNYKSIKGTELEVLINTTIEKIVPEYTMQVMESRGRLRVIDYTARIRIRQYLCGVVDWSKVQKKLICDGEE